MPFSPPNGCFVRKQESLSRQNGNPGTRWENPACLPDFHLPPYGNESLRLGEMRYDDKKDAEGDDMGLSDRRPPICCGRQVCRKQPIIGPLQKVYLVGT
jgi:hypothetical protein